MLRAPSCRRTRPTASGLKAKHLGCSDLLVDVDFRDRHREVVAVNMSAHSSRMQVELSNRKRWTTRIELATVIHDYIELFHNTRRRHSALGMLSPTDYEANYLKTNHAA
jgi:transposase InsO family protein